MAIYNVPLQQAHNPISISRSANTEAPKETDGKFSWDMARVQTGSEERFMRASARQTDGRSSLGVLGGQSLAKVMTRYPVNEIYGRPFKPRAY